MEIRSLTLRRSAGVYSHHPAFSSEVRAILQWPRDNRACRFSSRNHTASDAERNANLAPSSTAANSGGNGRTDHARDRKEPHNPGWHNVRAWLFPLPSSLFLLPSSFLEMASQDEATGFWQENPTH